MGILKKEEKKSRFSIDEKEREKKYIISDESAYKSAMLFCKKYDIDIDRDSSRTDVLDDMLEKFVNFIRLGIFEIKDDGTVIQHLKSTPSEDPMKTIKYGRLSGEVKRAMDGFDDNESNKRGQSLLGKLSGEGYDVIGKLEGTDLTAAETLGAIFLLAY